ncbi:EamA family transporter [Gammaproteobacteria bacterium 45_16_T64]|nr:EamA family transporter [Gammaproteobacteria bacterium 45_16_T64]
MNNENKGMIYGGMGVFGFGLTLPATRYIIEDFDPIFIGLGRAVFATVFAIAFLAINRAPMPTAKQWGALCVVALGGVIGFPLFSTIAMEYVPATHGAIVLGVLPLATALAGVIVSSERPSKGFWLTGITGSALIVVFTLREGAGNFQLGDLALLGAMLSAAIGYAVGGQLAKQMGGGQVICWAILMAFPLVLYPVVNAFPAQWQTISAEHWGGFVYLVLVSQLLAFFLWYKGLALGGIARVGQVQLLQPFVTITASVFLLNEAMNRDTLLFAILVVGTVALGKKMPIHQKPNLPSGVTS